MTKIKHYYLHEVTTVDAKFQKYFECSFKDFADVHVSVLFKRWTLDIFKFDMWLQNKFGNYVEEHKSMQQVVRERYGEDAAKFIATLI